MLRTHWVAWQTHFCPKWHPRISHAFTLGELRAVRAGSICLAVLDGAALFWGIRKILPWREV